MLFIDRLAEERREGQAEGRNQVIAELLQSSLFSEDVMAEALGISVEELRLMVKEK